MDAITQMNAAGTVLLILAMAFPPVILNLDGRWNFVGSGFITLTKNVTDSLLSATDLLALGYAQIINIGSIRRP
jgi:hypothetical protein